MASVPDGDKKLVSIKEIGGFELLDKLGQGAMGTVFRARQVSLDRIVALKVLPPSIARNQRFIERFQREARASAKLSHPNIVQGIDVGRDAATGLWYFAMEYVDGHSLQAELKQHRRLPEKRALEVTRDVARALEAVAAAGMVHRDVKPDNILLTRGDEVKLADLGLVKETDDDASLTQAGQTLGTPYYMAPEQVRGLVNELDVRTDLYALGGTLFHLVTGEPPFTGETSAVILAKHLGETPPFARKVNPEVSGECSELIAELLAKKPAERIQTPGEVVERIGAILNGTAALRPHKRTGARLTGPRTPVDAVAGVRRTGLHSGRSTGPHAGASRKPPALLLPLAAGLGVVLLVGGLVLLGRGDAAPAAPPPAHAKAAHAEPATANKPAAAPVPEKPATPPPTVALAPKPPAAPPPTAAPVPEKKAPAPPVALAPPTPTPAPPPPPNKVEPVPAAGNAQVAYSRFSEEFLGAVARDDLKTALARLDRAELDAALAPLRPELAQDRKALGWLGETDKLVLAGAVKLKDVAEFELRLKTGAPIKISKGGFQVMAVEDGQIQIGNQELRIPVALTKLHFATRQKLAELALGANPAEGLTALAYAALVDLKAGREPATPQTVRERIDKAQAAGTTAENAAYLRRVLQHIEKDANELLAQTAWDALTRLAAAGKWKELAKLLEQFTTQHGKTEFAQKKRPEIAEFLRKISASVMPQNGLALWLRADAGVKLDGGKVVAWQDQSGKGNNAASPSPDACPVLVPDAFNGRPALRFDGENDTCAIPTLKGEMSRYTIAWTLRPMSLRDWNQAISAGDGWGEFVFHTTDQGAVYAGTSVASRFSPGEIGPGTLTINVWSQFTYVFDDGQAYLYRNGKLLAHKLLAKAAWNGFRIGGYAGGNTIHGDMSGLVIYDRALNDTERAAVERQLLGTDAPLTTTPHAAH